MNDGHRTFRSSRRLVASGTMDTGDFALYGHIRQTSSARGVLFSDHNLVVDAAVEAALYSLLGTDRIGAIVLANSSGQATTPGMRGVYNPIKRVPIGSSVGASPTVRKDPTGLKSIGTWYGTYLNDTTDTVSYDMLGLVTQNDRLFAAKSFPAIDVAPGESIAFEWTIHIVRR